MKPVAWAAALTLVSLAVPGLAFACLMQAPLVLTDVTYADVVVVGRISHYKLIADQRWREDLRNRFVRTGGVDNLIDSFAPAGKFISDYARFDIQVDEVLAGQAPKTLTVTWDASTFGEAKSMPTGPLLIALRRPGSPRAPLRGPSATVFPDPEPGALTVLHPACAHAFIFPASGKEAAEVRQLLKGQSLP